MVDDQTCRTCPMRHQLITQAEEAILDRNALSEEVTSLTRRLAAAKAELTRRSTTHPLAGAVTAWLDYWQARTHTGKGRPPDTSPGGARWARALREMQRKTEHAERLGERDTTGWALAELKLAVDGIVLSPWHMGDNPSRKRYLKVENVLKNEEATDAFIEAGRQAQAEPVEVPLRWLSADAQERLRTVPWLLPLLRDALDSACEWNEMLEAVNADLMAMVSGDGLEWRKRLKRAESRDELLSAWRELDLERVA